jgi:hypothetical protein
VSSELLVEQLQSELRKTQSRLASALEELHKLRTTSSQNLELLAKVQSSQSLQLLLQQVRSGALVVLQWCFIELS